MEAKKLNFEELQKIEGGGNCGTAWSAAWNALISGDTKQAWHWVAAAIVWCM